jgi:hypothetical protein
VLAGLKRSILGGGERNLQGTRRCRLHRPWRAITQPVTDGWATTRELASSINTGRHEGSNGVECGGGVPSVQPTLRTLVGLRLLRYDGSLRKAACGTPL